MVNNDPENPDTVLKESLDKDEFYKIVLTWAEELAFDQVCSESVLAQIFSEFDADGDGVVSELDL